MPGILAVQFGGAIVNINGISPYVDNSSTTTGSPIVFSLVPPGVVSTVRWSYSPPTGSRSSLDVTLNTTLSAILAGVASASLIDIAGTYIIRCTVDSGVTYELSLNVAQSQSTVFPGPLGAYYGPPASIPTPLVGETIFSDSTNGGVLSSKDTAGVVTIVGGESPVTRVSSKVMRVEFQFGTSCGETPQLYLKHDASKNIVLTEKSGEPTGYNNTIVGVQAGYAIDSGNHNTLIGMQAGGSLSGGSYNTVVGAESLYGEIEGSFNTVVGAVAAQSLVSASQCTFAGYSADCTYGIVEISNSGAFGAYASVSASDTYQIGSRTVQRVGLGAIDVIAGSLSGGPSGVVAPVGSIYSDQYDSSLWFNTSSGWGRAVTVGTPNPVKIMFLGDSNTVGGGSTLNWGTMRAAFLRHMNMVRSDIELIGTRIWNNVTGGAPDAPSNSTNGGHSLVNDLDQWRHESYSGAMANGCDALYTYSISVVGAPHIAILAFGSSDILGTATTSATVVTRLMEGIDAMYAATPNTQFVVWGPAPCTDGYATHATLAANWTTLSEVWAALADPALQTTHHFHYWNGANSAVGPGAFEADGAHLNRVGASLVGAGLAAYVNNICPPLPGSPRAERPFITRPYANSAKIVTTSTDAVKILQHPGFNPGTGSFAIAIEHAPIAVTGGGSSIIQYKTAGSPGAGSYMILRNADGIQAYFNGVEITGVNSTDPCKAKIFKANQFSRIVLLANATDHSVALYVNGCLVAYKSGISSWSFAQDDVWIGACAIGGSVGWYGEVMAFQGNSVPAAFTYTALQAVRGDYYDGSPISSACSAYYKLSESAPCPDSVYGNGITTTILGGAVIATDAPLRPWNPTY